MITPLDKLYFDLFSTAFEGGINYWSETHDYHLWLNPNAISSLELMPDTFGFYGTLSTEEDGAETPHRRVDVAVIRRGWNLARSTDWRGRLRWSAEPPPILYSSDDDWDFDAGDADMILQLGLFKDVVYG